MLCSQEIQGIQSVAARQKWNSLKNYPAPDDLDVICLFFFVWPAPCCGVGVIKLVIVVRTVDKKMRQIDFATVAAILYIFFDFTASEHSYLFLLSLPLNIGGLLVGC